MSVISLDGALNYLNILREYMIDRDTQAAIEKEAFYLAALGLSTYTEILGGLYCGDLKKALGQHYTCFINEFFHSDYMKVDQNLKEDNLNGLYGAVRSGLAHEYFIKQMSKIEKDSPDPTNCGIKYNRDRCPQIVFYLNPYFRDFKVAFGKYYEKLKTNESGNLLRKFENALRGINSSLIDEISGDFRQDVSGTSL